MKTAVEWLVEQIKEYDFSPRDNTYLIEIPSWIFTEKIEQAKEMEKQQIINAYEQGSEDGYWHPENGYSNEFESAEQYYNETYESNH
jgi:hypothetical protein